MLPDPATASPPGRAHPSPAVAASPARVGSGVGPRLTALLERWLPSHRWFALVLALWVIDAGLRALQLGRPAPFGNPFVEKFEWYFFHALGFDARWALVPLLPLLGVELCCAPDGRWRGGVRAIAFWATVVALIPLQMLTLLDLEVMRFMGVHATPAFLATYLSRDATGDLGVLTGNDRGGPYLPLVLGAAAPVLTVALGVGMARWLERRRASRPWLSVGVAAYLVAGSVLTLAWGGGFRDRKLRPAIASWVELRSGLQGRRLSPARYAEARDVYRRLWLEGADRAWVFPDPERPLWRMTLEDACARGLGPDPRCAEDRDGDGRPARVDCDDRDPRAYPGAPDGPSNGVDEDCDGIDARPWNVLLVIMESHRGLDVGHLRPYGAVSDSTPVLDRLAAGGAFWTRHSSNGIPTIAAFMNLHCSIYELADEHIATSVADTALDCLPTVLRSHGYQTRFFSAAAPDWDNQTPWLVRWYGDYDFSRDRQTDVKMFRHLGGWMLEHLSDDRPFFVAAITKSNHYPFNAEADMTDEERAGTPDHIGATMRYADRAFGELLAAIEHAPWRRRTLVVVTGDHGVSQGEHDSWGVRAPLFRPTLWVPLVLSGDHPELTAVAGVHTEPTSHVDVMPTVLELLGIRGPTAAVGHSLASAAAVRYTFANAGVDRVFERGPLRALFRPPVHEGDPAALLFDVTRDPGELSPLPDPARLAEWDRTTVALQELTAHALGTDRVAGPPSGEVGAPAAGARKSGAPPR